MLRELTQSTTVYLVTGYSDLRKGIEGLAAVVQGSLSLDPFNKRIRWLLEGLEIEQPKAIRESKPGVLY